MSIRNTFIVLILLILVGGYAFYSSRQPAEEKTRLFNIKSDDISAITLKYSDHEIALAKEGGKWMLTQPLHAEADETVVKTIARAVADCEVKKTLESGSSDLAPFGLDKPQVTVTVTTTDKGAMPGIEVGRTTPVGFSAYIKTTDKPAVLLTAATFPPEVKKTVEELRNRQLVKFDTEDVQKVVLERPDAPTVELDQHDGTWTISKPAKYAADQPVVRQFMNSLGGTRVDEFVSEKPDSLAKFALDQPRLTISVSADKQPARTIAFGGKQTGTDKDTLYVRRTDGAPVYTVQHYSFNDVNKTLLDFRDKTVLTLEPSKVERMKFQSEGKNFSLERTADGKWELIDGASKDPADAAAIAEYLQKLRDAKGKSIAEDPMTDPKKFGMDAPTSEVVLSTKDGKVLLDLKLAKVQRRNQTGGATPAPVVRIDYYATSTANSAVYELDNVLFDELVKSAKEFRAATPTPEATSVATPKPAPNPAQPAASPAK
jgi:hypothetical protein